MSFKQAGQVWERELSREQVTIVMALADSADHDGSKIYPDVYRVAWKTGYSLKQAKDIMSNLIKSGLVIEHKDTDGKVLEWELALSSAPAKQPYKAWRREQAIKEREANQRRYQERKQRKVEAQPEEINGENFRENAELTEKISVNNGENFRENSSPNIRNAQAHARQSIVSCPITHTARETEPQTATVAHPPKPDSTTTAGLSAEAVKTNTVPRIDKPQPGVLFAAICEVCEREPDPNALTTAALKRMPELQRWLRAQCPDFTDVELSAELRRRFLRPNWTFDDPPQFSQLRDMWTVQGNRLNRTAEPTRRYHSQVDVLSNAAAFKQRLQEAAQ